MKQKTAYEMRISDWSSDVCSSDLRHRQTVGEPWWLARLDRRDRPAVFAALKHCRGSAASSCRLARVGPEVRVEPGCRSSPNLPIASLPAHYDAARARGLGPRARFGNKLRAWPSCTSTTRR